MFVRRWDLTTHNRSPVSHWVSRFAQMIPRHQHHRVLDYACGTGRHALYLSQLGLPVLAVDKDEASLNSLRDDLIACQPSELELRCIDLEQEVFSFADTREKFAGLVVTNYLYRPHLAQLLEILDEGGVFIYETFAFGNEKFGKPSNPDYLLKDNELLEVVMASQSFRIIAFESLYVEDPKPAMIQRICAIRTKDWATIL